MPPITRSGRRGRRRGVANDPPQVQVQSEPTQEEAIAVPAVQQNVQAVVMPQPTVPVYAPPNVDQGEDHTVGDSDAERPSTESLDVQFEGDEGETSRTKKSAQFDISFRVIDRRVQGIDKSIVVLVVECKYGSLTLDDIYQVAAYACTLAKENLAKGRYEPIYMEVWDERSWRYAIFYPEGLVKVVDGQVKGVTKTSTSMHYLQGDLDDHVTSLRMKYPNARYPDDEYLEGILYISMQKFLLPNATMEGGGKTRDAKLFYQSKLRIIAGDRVLMWTEEDVERAHQRRREQVQAALNAFLFEEGFQIGKPKPNPS